MIVHTQQPLAIPGTGHIFLGSIPTTLFDSWIGHRSFSSLGFKCAFVRPRTRRHRVSLKSHTCLFDSRRLVQRRPASVS